MKLSRLIFALEHATAKATEGTAVVEFATSAVPLTVDRETGVIRGVKLIGTESLNGRRYRPAVLAAAVEKYEGAKVNVGHVKGRITQPRDYADRLGVIRNVVSSANGLFGDLHYNPKHAIAEQLAWDAEHNPAAVGLSHAAFVRFRQEGKVEDAEEILRVVSLDLVGDPATTKGLFEEVPDPQLEPRDSQLETPSIETVEALSAAYPELIAEATEAATQAIRTSVAAGVQMLLGSQLPYSAWDSGLVDAIIVAEDAAVREQLIAERRALRSSHSHWPGERDRRRLEEFVTLHPEKHFRPSAAFVKGTNECPSNRRVRLLNPSIKRVINK
jgi:hypothetical protein